MKIEHMAIWTNDLEKMKNFYVKYFNAVSNEKYENKKKGFSSYFLKFSGGARLELMKKISIKKEIEDERIGLAHIAFSLGKKEKVDELTERLRIDGYRIVGEARTTGDGYYESVVLDPENNRLELTI